MKALLVAGLILLGVGWAPGSATAAGSYTSSPGTCTSPVSSSGLANASYYVGNNPTTQVWWVNNDAWSGSPGPQTINVCGRQSWNAVSNQPNDGGSVETYPDTEYDVGGRGSGGDALGSLTSVTSTYAESDPTTGNDGWDAAYDLWTDNWAHETMIWNQWSGSQAYWYTQATGPNGYALTLDGIPYHFYANGSELMFFRDTMRDHGSVDILAAYQWEIANGFASSTDDLTQIEYGTEVAYTNGPETFNTTGFTVSLS
jgi:hypothetical protein